MKHTTLALAMAAALIASACLVKDTTSTIYLRQDGSFDWVILEQNVRSDESDEDSRAWPRRPGTWTPVSRGEFDLVNGLLALGGDNVRVQWLRNRRPYAVMVDARFDSLAGVFDRLLAPCGIPYESGTVEADGVTTWTLRADVGVDGERLEAADADDCGRDLAGLSDAVENLRIILESGTFTAATGFTLEGTVAAGIDGPSRSAARRRDRRTRWPRRFPSARREDRRRSPSTEGTARIRSPLTISSSSRSRRGSGASAPSDAGRDRPARRGTRPCAAARGA